MHTAPLDDPDFLTELDKLEPGRSAEAERDSVAYYRPTLEEWARDQGITLSPPDESIDIPTQAAVVGRWVVAAVTIVGTLTGAAMAAVVFHEQVQQILAR